MEGTINYVMGEDRKTFRSNGRPKDTVFKVSTGTETAESKFNEAGEAEVKLANDVVEGQIVKMTIGDDELNLRIVATTASPVATDPDPDDDAVVVAPDTATPAPDPRVDNLDADLEALETKVGEIESEVKTAGELLVRLDKRFDETRGWVKWFIAALLLVLVAGFAYIEYKKRKASATTTPVELTLGQMLDKATSGIDATTEVVQKMGPKIEEKRTALKEEGDKIDDGIRKMAGSAKKLADELERLVKFRCPTVGCANPNDPAADHKH